MSRNHKLILLAAVVGWIAVSIPVVLEAATVAGTLVSIATAVGVGAVGVVFVELLNRHDIDAYSILRIRYAFPVTAYRMAHNQKILAENEARELGKKARECSTLAKSYRKRDEPYQAELLEVQADHYKRMADIRSGDARRFGRELEDCEMRELTR